MPSRNLTNEFRAKLVAGTRLLQANLPEAATPLLEQARALGPYDEDAALNLAAAYILTKRWRQAVRLLETATSRSPDSVQLWTNLGAAYLGNPTLASDDQQQKAIAAFQRALALDSNARSVHYNIALIYRDRGELPEAIAMLEKAIEAEPTDRDAHRLLSRLRSGMEGPAQAQDA